ncbi:hypothetical protein E4U53_005891 [Claviceps sorghi]|nr:hypothetical protein E4U53_005891 [Claviceps sorghi]
MSTTTSKEWTNDCSSAVNLLPCGVGHDGDTGQTANLWNPTKPSDGNQTAYFRGRKLAGKCLRLPEQYIGAVAQINNDNQRLTDGLEMSESKDQPDMEPPPAGQNLHITSTFDEICIWTHGSTSNGPDQYAKGVEEWLYTAERLRNSITIRDVCRTPTYVDPPTANINKSDMASQMTLADKPVKTGKTYPQIEATPARNMEYLTSIMIRGRLSAIDEMNKTLRTIISSEAVRGDKPGPG